MSELPKERRRRAKLTEPAEPATTDAGPSDPPPASRRGAGAGSLARIAFVWPLITGLAIGFAVGREAYRFGLSDTGRSGEPGAASTAVTPDKGAKAYAKMADFPAGWLKDTDLGKAGAPLAGLTDAQKTTVMQALNERNCECGCTFGTLATCLQKDPGCPRSPAMIKLAVELVKQGKALPEILAAIDAKQKDMAGGQKPKAAPEPPSGPKRVELAAWNPRKGPKAARVTLVEFSDFQ